MGLDQKAADQIASRFFSTEMPVERLGWGVSGFVYLSPDLRTAVKIHRYEESFQTELAVYRRLKAFNITRVCGLTVPRLMSFSLGDRILQMDFVKAPYLLDFAGCKLSPPDPQLLESWDAALEEMFGPNVGFAYDVYGVLARHGIYYLDFRPSNMNLEGHPDVIPFTPPSWDDL